MDEAKRAAQQSFLDTLETLLLGLRSVFPECPHVKENLDDLQQNIIPNTCGRHLVISKWHNDMKPYYGACERRNIKKILASDLDLVSELHMNEKWRDAGFGDESKEALWHFIDDLNKYARAYHPDDVVSIDINDDDDDDGKTLDADITAALEENDMFRLLPPEIARRLKEQAKTVTNSLIQGETTMENLDFSQLMGVASDLGNQCSAEDLQQMMTHLPQLMSSFNQTTQAASELGVSIPMANMMQTLAASGAAGDSNEVEQITGLFATMASNGGGSNGGSMQQMMSIMKFAQHSEKHFEQKQE